MAQTRENAGRTDVEISIIVTRRGADGDENTYELVDCARRFGRATPEEVHAALGAACSAFEERLRPLDARDDKAQP